MDSLAFATICYILHYKSLNCTHCNTSIFKGFSRIRWDHMMSSCIMSPVYSARSVTYGAVVIWAIREVVWIIERTLLYRCYLVNTTKMSTIWSFWSTIPIAYMAVAVGIIDLWRQGMLFCSTFASYRMHSHKIVFKSLWCAEYSITDTVVIV